MTLLMIAALAAQPQDADERLRALEERLTEIERRHAEEVQALRAEIDRLRQEQPEKAPTEVTMAERLTVRSADGAFEFKPRGRLQVDARFYGDPRAPALLVRRARLGFEGKLGGWVTYLVEGQFDSAGTLQLNDALLTLEVHEALRLTFGRQKEPLSVEELCSSRYVLALERSVLSDSIPERAVGALVHGKPFGKLVEYQFGIFSNQGGWDATARLILSPFAEREGPLRGLSFGMAALSSGRLDARPASIHTEVRTTFLAYPAGTEIRRRDRWIPQLAWYNLGPVSFWAEYGAGDDALRAAGARRDVAVRAAHVTAGWMITGEERGPSRVTPLRPVTLREGGGAGAFELVARHSQVRYGRRAFLFAPAAGQARRAHELTAGLNWFLTSSLRIGVNYVRTRFGTRVLLGSRLRRVENAVLLRFQVEY